MDSRRRSCAHAREKKPPPTHATMGRVRNPLKMCSPRSVDSSRSRRPGACPPGRFWTSGLPGSYARFGGSAPRNFDFPGLLGFGTSGEAVITASPRPGVIANHGAGFEPSMIWAVFWQRPTRSTCWKIPGSGLAETIESVISGLDLAIQAVDFIEETGCTNQARA